MLIDLYLLQTYFAEPSSVIYEEELIRRYGGAAVRQAIKEGMLEKRQIPCKSGAVRHVCTLSDDGILTVRRTIYPAEENAAGKVPVLC
ncbi:MAG: hypothetical protein H6867_01670 [Rhodospirillales bacterium]|nr:hypothetical protein [Rhodospirillales bacterium]MCB9997226.1 hypothetical protein [Rhodospirillales bacterium]